MADQEEIRNHDLLQALQSGDSIFRQEFLEYHTYDQAQFFLSLEQEQRMQMYIYLSPEEMSNVFEILEEDVEDVATYLLEMDKQYAADMLMQMYTDNAVDILKKLDPEQARVFLRRMPNDTVKDILDLFQYPDETAGALMTTEYISIVASQTVEQAMQLLKKSAREAETIYYVYVVDTWNRLVGIVSLRDMIVSAEDTLVMDIMIDKIVSVQVTDDQETVAQRIRDYDLLAVPVVGIDQELLGIITVDDIIDVIDEEAVSDYSGLAGIDVEDISENPFKSAFQRLPWLLALIVIAMVTSSLISRYKGLLEEASVLSIFITLITGAAGNAGTQSLAVAVRKIAMSSTEKLATRKLILSELITGLVTGLVTGVFVMLAVALLQQNIVLGAVIGLAMMSAITVSNLVGSLIPIGMNKLGVDPAIASGPFISTISDLISVLIYFSIASYFVQFLFVH